MHRPSERPLAFPGDGDAQDEVLAKVVVDDGPRRGGEGVAARAVAPAPPLCVMSWILTLIGQGLKVSVAVLL